MKLLVAGFGPFGEVVDNPAARLARAVDGARRAELVVFGAEIPVSYTRGIARTVQLARAHRADSVLGVGVAVRRPHPELERVGRARCGTRPDVDGACPDALPGPAEIPSTLDVPTWARALGCSVSDDAGSYVCNGWLHQVSQQLVVPVGFLHIPPAGVDPAWFLAGLGRVVTGADPT